MMTGWTVTFFILTIAAGVLGFTIGAGSFAFAVQVLAVVFAVLLIASIFYGIIARQHPRFPLP